jgi:hypothetical protein
MRLSPAFERELSRARAGAEDRRRTAGGFDVAGSAQASQVGLFVGILEPLDQLLDAQIVGQDFARDLAARRRRRDAEWDRRRPSLRCRAGGKGGWPGGIGRRARPGRAAGSRARPARRDRRAALPIGRQICINSATCSFLCGRRRPSARRRRLGSRTWFYSQPRGPGSSSSARASGLTISPPPRTGSQATTRIWTALAAA